MPRRSPSTRTSSRSRRKRQDTQRRPDRTWGGLGVGAPYAVCEQPVTKDEMEFEIEFAHDGTNPGLHKFHVHMRCFAAWEFERNKPPQ
jgi:hypothetical protein